MFCFKSQKEFTFKLVLLDDREFKFTYKGSQKCQQLLNDASKLLNLEEKDYFGFRFIDYESQAQWIDLVKDVQSQFKLALGKSNLEKNTELIVYFSVKYYLPDPCKLNDETTRYLFYLQLRKDISVGRLPVQFDYAVDLFGYFLQSELGDSNPKRDTHGYASEFEFISNQSIELEKAAEAKHLKLKGMSQATAEMNFLNKAKWLDLYGVDLQPVVGENNMEYFIGLTPTGISVYQNKIKINSYFWPRISKLNYKEDKFFLSVVDKTNEEKTHIFIASSKPACKHLWKCCVDHHKFFRLKAVYEEPAKISTSLAMSKQNRVSTKSLTDCLKNESKIKRMPAKRIPRRQSGYLNEINIGDHEAIVIDVNKISLTDKLNNENENSQYKSRNSRNDIEKLINQGGLFGSSSNINEITSNKNPSSPTASAKSINSYKCPNPIRRDSASESETGIRRKYGSRNRSKTRRTDNNNDSNKRNDTDSDNENLVKYVSKMAKASCNNEMVKLNEINEVNKHERHRSSSRHKRRSHHRSHSRGSNKASNQEANWSNLIHQKMQNEGNKASTKSRKSLTDQNSGVNLIGQELKKNYYETSETCHETTMDENDLNEAEKKRQVRRRKRSKSPGATTKPPEEILQHIKYNLVEPGNGMSADQLKEIPFVKIETVAPPFRISPHQKHRRYSPHRRKSQEFHDSKSSIAYLSNGTAHIVKTNKVNDNVDSVVSVPNVMPVSMGSAVNTRLSHFGEPATNIGFSADSGCEDMPTSRHIGLTNSLEIFHHLLNIFIKVATFYRDIQRSNDLRDS